MKKKQNVNEKNVAKTTQTPHATNQQKNKKRNEDLLAWGLCERVANLRLNLRMNTHMSN